MKLLKLIDVNAIVDDVTTGVVPCPKWGGDVMVRSLAGHERDQFDFWRREHILADKPQIHIRARLVAMSWCDDEKGTPAAITDSEILALSNRDGATLDALYDKCCELSKVMHRDPSNAGEVPKNSSAQSTDSGSSSPGEKTSTPSEKPSSQSDPTTSPNG